MTRTSFRPLAVIIAVGLCAFQTATIMGLVLLDPIVVRSGHVAFVFSLIFLLRPPLKRYRKAPESEPKIFLLLDVLLVAACTASCLYIITDLAAIQDMMPGIDDLSAMQMAFGFVLIFCVLEATRRTAGAALLAVACTALVYAFFGHLLPGSMGHLELETQRIIENLYLLNDGVWGTSIGASSTIIYLFVLFGALLSRSSMANVFLDLACLATRKTRGGPAKASIFGSALFGSVSGSAAANVYATGTFTIPLMKRVGYAPHFAGAVEAVASSGGLITPPVMGSIAFVMSEVTNISYLNICKAALFPAILYYLGLFVMIHFEAMRHGIGGTPEDMVPRKSDILRRLYYIVPLVILVAVMVSGMSVSFSAAAACTTILILSCFRKETRFTFERLLGAVMDAANNMLMICACCACVGVVIGVVSMTGFGFSFAAMMDTLASVNVLVFLLVLMATCMLFGMGLPSLPAYLLVATFGAPSLVNAGIPLVAAHMFVMYFAIVSGITPPVCLVAYAGASIAEASPMKTGFTAFRLGITAYLVPFFFIFEPALLLMGTWQDVVPAIATAVVGIVALAAGMQRWLLISSSPVEQILCLAAGVLLIYPGCATDGAGLVLLLAALLLQRCRRSTAPASAR